MKSKVKEAQNERETDVVLGQIRQTERAAASEANSGMKGKIPRECGNKWYLNATEN